MSTLNKGDFLVDLNSNATVWLVFEAHKTIKNWTFTVYLNLVRWTQDNIGVSKTTKIITYDVSADKLDDPIIEDSDKNFYCRCKRPENWFNPNEHFITKTSWFLIHKFRKVSTKLTIWKTRYEQKREKSI